MKLEQPQGGQNPAAALAAAVAAVGGQAAMARLVGVAQPSVFKWLRGKKALPAKYVLTVEEATGISRHDLNPEIYPREASDDHAAPVDLEPTR